MVEQRQGRIGPPPGRQPLSHEFIVGYQRARIITALAEESAEKGYRAVTVAAVMRRVGLDRQTFYRHFADKEDCYLRGFDTSLERIEADAQATMGAERSWALRLRAGLGALLGFLDVEPALGWALIVEPHAVGPKAVAKCARTMERIVAFLEQAPAPPGPSGPAPPFRSTVVTGGIHAVIHSRLLSGATDGFSELLPDLMHFTLLSYPGHALAIEQLRGGSERSAGYGRQVTSKGPHSSPDLPDRREEYPPELARLPPGRHGLPREFIANNQRQRLIAGMAEAVAADGYSAITITSIIARAAVSRTTFYQHFTSKDECFVAAHEALSAGLGQRLDEAFEQAGDWPQAVSDGIRALLQLMAAEPQVARVCTVEALSAGPGVLNRYDAPIDDFLAHFRNESDGCPAELRQRFSPLIEEALVGGMLLVIVNRVLADQTAELEKLTPELVEIILTFYLGRAQAAKIAKTS